MKNVIRVSIIMGIYNCADTLPAALDSIVNQTYTGWKIIMCDDGSRDNTYEIAASYVEKYPDKIRLIKNKENKGLNYTLNRCLSLADTEYIARMDGDDLSLPERLEKEISFLDEHPEYAIVSTPMQYFDEQGIFRVGIGSGAVNKKSFVRGTPFCHAPCMVRKIAYDAVEGYSVDEKLLRVEDWHLWVKMYAAGFRGYNLAEPLYMMRDDRNATGRRKFKFRLNESYVSRLSVKLLKLPKWYYVYSLRPIIVGLLPRPLYTFLHRRNIKKQGDE